MKRLNIIKLSVVAVAVAASSLAFAGEAMLPWLRFQNNSTTKTLNVMLFGKHGTSIKDYVNNGLPTIIGTSTQKGFRYKHNKNDNFDVVVDITNAGTHGCTVSFTGHMGPGKFGSGTISEIDSLNESGTCTHITAVPNRPHSWGNQSVIITQS